MKYSWKGYKTEIDTRTELKILKIKKGLGKLGWFMSFNTNRYIQVSPRALLHYNTNRESCAVASRQTFRFLRVTQPGLSSPPLHTHTHTHTHLPSPSWRFAWHVVYCNQTGVFCRPTCKWTDAFSTETGSAGTHFSTSGDERKVRISRHYRPTSGLSASLGASKPNRKWIVWTVECVLFFLFFFFLSLLLFLLPFHTKGSNSQTKLSRK